MNIKEFAKKINGRKFGYFPFTEEEINIAKENGFIIAYVISSNHIKYLRLAGSIKEDFRMYFDGIRAYITKRGFCDVSYVDFPTRIVVHFQYEENECGDSITWTILTDIPYETFILLDGNKYPYCKGIVFDIRNVADSHE